MSERTALCDGHHYTVIETDPTGGDVCIGLDGDDRLYVTEKISDAMARGLIRFSDQQRIRGAASGKGALRAKMRKLLGVPSDYAFEALKERVEDLKP